jgi:predicted nucleic acid-binding protein
VAVALDADAIIGFLDRSDALHDPAAKLVSEAASADTLVTSAVTVAEVLTGALLGHQDEELVRGFFSDLIATVIPVDNAIAEQAARLRSKHSLRMPDAIVLATATIHSDVAALITGDEQIAKAGKSSGLEIRLLKGAD